MSFRNKKSKQLVNEHTWNKPQAYSMFGLIKVARGFNTTLQSWAACTERQSRNHVVPLTTLKPTVHPRPMSQQPLRLQRHPKVIIGVPKLLPPHQNQN